MKTNRRNKNKVDVSTLSNEARNIYIDLKLNGGKIFFESFTEDVSWFQELLNAGIAYFDETGSKIVYYNCGIGEQVIKRGYVRLGKRPDKVFLEKKFAVE